VEAAEAGVEVVSKAMEGVETLDGVGEVVLEAGELDLEDLLGVLGALEDGCEAIAEGSHRAGSACRVESTCRAGSACRASE
jgi:hypothetical protein